VPLELTLAGLPLLAFRSSPEYYCSGAAATSKAGAASSLAVPFPFGVFPVLGSHLTRKEPPFRFRCLPSVSHALKAFIRPTPASQFRAGAAHGVSPSGSKSTRGACRLLRRACLPEVSGRDVLPHPSARLSILGSAHVRSGPSIEARRFPFAPLQGLVPRGCRCFWPSLLSPAKNPDPPGLHLLKGVSTSTGRLA